MQAEGVGGIGGTASVGEGGGEEESGGVESGLDSGEEAGGGLDSGEKGLADGGATFSVQFIWSSQVFSTCTVTRRGA